MNKPHLTKHNGLWCCYNEHYHVLAEAPWEAYMLFIHSKDTYNYHLSKLMYDVRNLVELLGD